MTISTPIPKEPTIVEPVTGERPVIEVESPQLDFEKKKTIVRSKQVIWYVWLVVETILLLRFGFKLFAANFDNIFGLILAAISAPFVFPFETLSPPTVNIRSNVVVEWSTLTAMIVYALIAWLISHFFKLRKPIDPNEAEEKVEQTNPL